MKTIDEIEKLIKDPVFRANLANDTHTYAQQLGYLEVEGVDFKVVTNTKTTFHYVMPNYNDETLAQIADIQAAGVKASTVGTVGTAGTASTFTTSVGSLGTLASLGSAACGAGDIKIG